MRKNKIVYNDFAALAEEFATVPAVGSSNYQNAGYLLDIEKRNIINFASFEGEGIDLLDLTLELADEGDQVGYVSEAISSNSKETDVKIIIDLAEGYYTSPGITIHFFKDHCKEVHIEWIKDSTKIDETDAFPDKLSYFVNHFVENYNRIVLTIKQTSSAFQFVKIAGIDLGRTREITKFIGPINIFKEISTDCSDVPGATCDFEAFLEEDFTPQNEQKILVYSNDELFGRFIVENAVPQGEGIYSFECSDEITRLENSSFAELPQGKYSVGDLTEAIRSASNIRIDAENLADVMLEGFVQKDNSSRYAAAMLSFATGAFLIDEKNKLRLRGPIDKKDKIISSNQIIGKALCRKKTPYMALVLRCFEGDFKNIKLEKTELNPNRKASDSIGALVFDKYSLFADFENRFSEILEMGFSRDEIEADIILYDEQIGDIVKIETAYSGVKVGIIKSIDISLSTIATAHVVLEERAFREKGE